MNTIRDSELVPDPPERTGSGPPEHGAGRVPAVERAVRILHALKAANGRLRLSDLSLDLDLSKSTLSDLLATMAEAGLVERDPLARTYRLGPVLVELGLAARAQPDLVLAARRELDWLCEATGETAILHAPSGAEAVIVAACESKHQLKVVAPVGHRLPALAGSVAKVLLSTVDGDPLAGALGAGPLPAFTSRSITDERRYRDQLGLTRRRGYATDDEEYLPGVRAASAPVLDAAGVTVAVLTVVAASSRLARGRLPALGEHVRGAAARVSSLLGAGHSGMAHPSAGHSATGGGAGP